VRKLTSAGSFMLAGVHYMVGGTYGFQQILVIVDGD
jgi:putative transposase